MIVETKAIVLSAIKYGDTDLIVKCYTESGVKSYLLKRIFKKKGKLKVSYFQPLTQLFLVAYHQNKGALNYIKEASVIHPYQTVQTNIIKQTLAIFLSEILSRSLHEEESNQPLFSFLETTLVWLDTHDEVSNFHLLFLLNLSRHLGFYPDKENENYHYFDLQEGLFLKEKPKNQQITGNDLKNFRTLLGTNFDGLTALKFNGKERQQLLNILIQYFELHLPTFQRPKSLTILNTIFA